MTAGGAAVVGSGTGALRSGVRKADEICPEKIRGLTEPDNRAVAHFEQADDQDLRVLDPGDVK
jgi:hypothetical protein